MHSFVGMRLHDGRMPLALFRRGEDRRKKKREVLHLFRCYTHTHIYLSTAYFQGCRLSDRNFQGTLIRAPLRRQQSDISSQCFGTEDVRKLVGWIEADGHDWLLFLRKVAKLEVIDLCSNEAWIFFAVAHLMLLANVW